MFWWAGLWVLIDVAAREGRIAQAIADSRLLFGPDQAKVPDPIATPLHRAVEAWEAGEEETTRELLGEALGLAREMAYL